MLIVNLGEADEVYISSLRIKKLTNLKKLYLRGDDYDYSLKEIPMDFLRLKNLKTIILENVAYTFSIINYVKKHRPDIIVKSLDYEDSFKFLSYENDSLSKWKIKIVYPNEIVSYMGFEIDSILRKEKLNADDYLILAQSYLSDNPNYQMMKTFEFCDSLYNIYGDSLSKCQCTQPYASTADTLKAIDYLNKAIALNDNNYSTIYYACFFYQKLIEDKNKACYYFKKLQNTPPPHNIFYFYSSNRDGIHIYPYIEEDELEECNFVDY